MDQAGRGAGEGLDGSVSSDREGVAEGSRDLPPLVPDDEDDERVDDPEDSEDSSYDVSEEEEDDEDYVEGIDADIAADAREVEDLIAERYGREDDNYDYDDDEAEESYVRQEWRGPNMDSWQRRGHSRETSEKDEWQSQPYDDPDSASSSAYSATKRSAATTSARRMPSPSSPPSSFGSPPSMTSTSPASSASTLRYLESLRNSAEGISSSSHGAVKQGAAKRRGRPRREWLTGNAEDLFFSARAGDLKRVRWLVEGLGIRVNQRDRWDSTPLYYACLAGHLPIVRYLLQSGARCEANTFDGERCLHGALTNEIRKVLREYKAVAVLNDPYSRFLHNLFLAHTDDLRQSNSLDESDVPASDEGTEFGSDICFSIGNEDVKAHRCILACRSSYFKDMLRSAWASKSTILLSPSRMNAQAFRAVVQFLYTERLETSRENINDSFKIARQARLDPLKNALNKELLKEKLQIELPERAVLEYADVYGCISGLTPLQREFGILALRSIGRAFGVASAVVPPTADVKGPQKSFTSTPLPVDVESRAGSWFEDIRFIVGDKAFDCHKFFFHGRSEYFKALLMGNFVEGRKLKRSTDASTSGSGTTEDEANIASLVLSDLSPEAFAMIVDFMYTNSMTNALALLKEIRRNRSQAEGEESDDEDRETDEERDQKEEWVLLFETLQLADMYMLPVLKNQCVTYLNECINIGNVWGLYKTAQLYGLGRLEAACIDFAALNLDHVVNDTEFEELVQASAMSIKDRQEIDTIPLIDEVRTAIWRIYIEIDPAIAGREEMVHEGKRRLGLIDTVLDKLGLQA